MIILPRKSRERSQTGIYHIMLRGINKQNIFLDNEDRQRFVDTLIRFKKQCNFKLHGWCFMKNHEHLLMEEGSEDISNTIRRICVSYASYYNLKYERVGHLLQDRYKSESVEKEEYLLTVIRYIHQNPVKAGFVNKPDDWQWSSCKNYYSDKNIYNNLTDTELILRIFSHDIEEARKRFIIFNEAANNDHCLDITEEIKITDKIAREKIYKVVSKEQLNQINKLPKKERNSVIKKIKQLEGISQRQAARILGISPSLFFRN